MYELLIIGAGPAGISMGVEAVKAGICSDKILIIEKAHEHSYTIKKYYHDKKIVTANYKGFNAVCKGVMCIDDTSKAETISFLDDAINRHNLDVKYNEAVYKIEQEPYHETFTVHTNNSFYISKTVVIAIGILGKPNKPDYPLPVSLGNKIFYDITSQKIENKKLLVVGGGDTASEYVQFLSAAGLNNDVYLSYRQSSFRRMNDINRNSLLHLYRREKIHLFLNTNITAVEDNAGKIIVSFSGVNNFKAQFDTIVYALGGSTPVNFLKAIGIAFKGPGPVLTEGYETNIPGLFLIGDIAAQDKGGSLIWAFNSSNAAMQRICSRYINCLQCSESYNPA